MYYGHQIDLFLGLLLHHMLTFNFCLTCCRSQDCQTLRLHRNHVQCVLYIPVYNSLMMKWFLSELLLWELICQLAACTFFCCDWNVNCLLSLLVFYMLHTCVHTCTVFFIFFCQYLKPDWSMLGPRLDTVIGPYPSIIFHYLPIRTEALEISSEKNLKLEMLELRFRVFSAELNVQSYQELAIFTHTTSYNELWP